MIYTSVLLAFIASPQKASGKVLEERIDKDKSQIQKTP